MKAKQIVCSLMLLSIFSLHITAQEVTEDAQTDVTQDITDDTPDATEDVTDEVTTEGIDCSDCPVNANLSDPRIQQLARDAVAIMHTIHGCRCIYHLEEIVHATTQDVEDGEFLHYDVIVGYSMYMGHQVTRTHLCSLDMWLKETEIFEKVTVNFCENIQ
ncbi:hypothetical protein L9F63_017872, partial [Diploptera punctata]